MLKRIKLQLKKIKLPSTSKLLLLGVVLICMEIILFCEYMMVLTGDLSSMYVLIGIPAAMTPTIWGYYSKARSENTRGGIVFETAMKKQENIADENAQG